MADTYADIPELSAQQAGILRRRKIAEAIQAQSMQPLQSQQLPGGYVVPTSPLLGIGKVLEAYLAKKGLNAADTAETGLADKYKGMEAEAVKNYKTKFNDQVNPYPVNEQMSPEAQQFAQADGQQIVPGDKRGAIVDALTSPYKGLNVAGTLDMKAMEAEANDKRDALNRTEAAKQTALDRADAAKIAAEGRTDAAKIAAEAKLQAARQHSELLMALADKKAAVSGAKLTEGQKAVDRNYGKEYAEYQAGGGSADVEKQLVQLEQVSNELGKKGNDYTGGVVGLIPEKVRSITNPDAVAAQNKVEEVAQRNLRLVLGAQFTQVEGERLIKRAYNPQMSPTENKRRVDALIKQIRTAAQVKEDAARYFEENGTLTGWKGRMPTLADFDAALDGVDKVDTPVQFDADKEARYQAWKAKQGK